MSKHVPVCVVTPDPPPTLGPVDPPPNKKLMIHCNSIWNYQIIDDSVMESFMQWWNDLEKSSNVRKLQKML